MVPVPLLEYCSPLTGVLEYFKASTGFKVRRWLGDGSEMARTFRVSERKNQTCLNYAEREEGQVNGEDYICITDMLKAKDGDFFVTDWLRNRNTMEFLGVWERVYNPNFNYGEFATIRNQSGLNSFKISVKEFVARTGAISLHYIIMNSQHPTRCCFCL